MDFELNGKKAIVSAGGSGIGLSIVEEFIKQGVSVSTCDIDRQIKLKVQLSPLLRGHICALDWSLVEFR